MLTQKKLKRLAEGLAGDKIWIDRSPDLHQIKDLIASVYPKMPQNFDLKRFGSNGDGGYLMPNDLDGVKICVSPGVSTEIGFDLEMANKGLQVYMADASVEGPPENHPNFNFFKKFLEVYNNESSIRIDDLCAKIPSNLDGDRILQMDIEGAEYRVILDMSDETLRSFRVMLIEFHFLPQIFSRFPIDLIRATFDKLSRYHSVVHIHPNNCCGSVVRGEFEVPQAMEFTFYRNDRGVMDSPKNRKYPHSLDVDNVLENPKMILPKCWYENS